MVTHESGWDGDGAAARPNAFDCSQSTLQTKRAADLQGSFEAQKEIVSFCLLEVNMKLLRNSKKQKQGLTAHREESLGKQREIPKKPSSSSKHCSSKHAAAAAPLDLSVHNYPPRHQRPPCCRSNTASPSNANHHCLLQTQSPFLRQEKSRSVPE